MKKGIHVRKINHIIVQTDGSKIRLKMALPVVKSDTVLHWEKSGVCGLSLSLNQDSRSNTMNQQLSSGSLSK
jgi:hypothetical protein